MHYGEPLNDERLLAAIRTAWERGVRTFVTADVYGNGAADEMLGRGLAGLPRDSYCLVGAIGHDFYEGQRQGAKGYPRFTDPSLRAPREFDAYLRMAAEKSLERCQTDHFDCLLLHNPDATGYGSDAVWNGMERLQETRLTRMLGIAPGPANGFTLDIILNFERFGALIDCAMIILNPLEPWPGALCLPAAEKHGVEIMTRVVDYGGLFHDDVKPGHEFGKQDHRAFRPAGWVEAGYTKIEKLRPFAERHALTLLQLACVWNLSHQPVRTVVPTLIQEIGTGAKSIEEKIAELASLPDFTLSDDEREEIRRIGDNTGCMELKGANPAHSGETLPDRWSISNDLSHVAQRWRIEPTRDLAYTHAAAS